MEDRVWLQHYPAGVPADIDVDACGSVVDLVERAFDKYAALPALASGDTTLSFRDLDRHSRAIARWLLSKQDLQAGSRIGVMLPNVLQYPIAVLGILRASMVIVNINPMYTARELSNQLRDAGCAALVIQDSGLPMVGAIGEDSSLAHLLIAGPSDLTAGGPDEWSVGARIGGAEVTPFQAAVAAGASSATKLPRPAAQDLAVLQYTGGTTGVPKAAMLTHRNLVANVEQKSAWFQGEIKPGEEVIVTALPLYHIFAFTTNFLFGLRWGALDVLVANPRDLPGLVQTMTRHRWTIFAGVNTLYNGLLHTPGFADLDFSSVKICTAGGTSTQRAVAQRWKQVTGHDISEGYGMSEASPTISTNPLNRGFSGTIGMPLPSTWVQVRGANDLPVDAGQPGEICVRGPQVTQGYWQRPDETALAFSPDGWLRTGDIGTMDKRGQITLTDRKKDMVLVSGFNVYPNEVENVLAEHPDVFESAVVGVPDAETGEAVKAFVVRRGTTVSSEALRTHCRGHLAAYKVPRHVVFVDALPKSPVGKILRRELRNLP